MEKLRLRRFDDMHCHLRSGKLLRNVLPCTVAYASRAVAMPNLRPHAVLDAMEVHHYKNEILFALDEAGLSEFEPIMTIEVRDSTTPDMIEKAFRAGAVAGKVYPLGVTTNSDEGLRSFHSQAVRETFRAMQDLGMLLLIHGELDERRVLVTERESRFLPLLTTLACEFDKLKIVLEHVSTKAAVLVVARLGPNVAATITAHHLFLTLNDVIGYGIQPHNGCMPMPKGFEDRDALIAAATSGDPKFFLGSDSAPHPKEKKECAKGACGVFTAPNLPALLAEVFEEAGALDKLEDFSSKFGAEFYGLPLNRGHIELVRSENTVPTSVGGVVPFRAGETLQWELVR